MFLLKSLLRTSDSASFDFRLRPCRLAERGTMFSTFHIHGSLSLGGGLKDPSHSLTIILLYGTDISLTANQIENAYSCRNRHDSMVSVNFSCFIRHRHVRTGFLPRDS